MQDETLSVLGSVLHRTGYKNNQALRTLWDQSIISKYAFDKAVPIITSTLEVMARESMMYEMQQEGIIVHHKLKMSVISDCAAVMQQFFKKMKDPLLYLNQITFFFTLQSSKQMACGFDHTITLSDDGTAYSFGRNEFGALGLGHNKVVSLPTPIPNLPKIKLISCGAYFTVCVDCEGFIW